MSEIAVPARPAAAGFGNLRHLALASFYFGLSFTWLPYPLVILQSQIHDLFPPGQRNTVIGYTTSVGAVFAVLVPPLVGAWSDGLTTRWGRRRPLMVAGALVSVVGLFLMMTASNYPQLLIGHLIVQCFLNGSAAAYYAIIPDVVPKQEFGKASGFLAGMTQAGALLGFGVTTVMSGLHQVRLSYSVMAVVLLLSVIPVMWAARGEGSQAVERGQMGRDLLNTFLRPFWTGDFAWVIFTRMMIVAGVAAVAFFLSNFFRDVVGVSNPDQFTSIWLGVVFASMILPGLWGGAASDRYGRKIFVYASGAFQAAVALFFIVFYPTHPGIVLGLAVFYGLGYGLYFAVDWALACDTVPDRVKAAKDMGLFHVAQTLPNSLVPQALGPLIDYFNRQSPNSGYRVAFASVIFFFLLGTIFVRRIRSVR